MWSCLFQGQFVNCMLGLLLLTYMSNLRSLFTHYEDKKGNAKCRIWGGLVAGNVTILYDFISDFNKIYASVLYCFQVASSYLSKVADFILPHLHLSPPLETPFDFDESFGFKNQNPWAIVWHCLCDPMFSHFDIILACDGQTYWHVMMAYTTLS